MATAFHCAVVDIAQFKLFASSVFAIVDSASLEILLPMRYSDINAPAITVKGFKLIEVRCGSWVTTFADCSMNASKFL